MTGVILLVLLYLSALILSLLKPEWAKTAGRAALGCTIIIPCLIWAYIWMYGKIFHKSTIADVNLFGNPTDHSPAITADVPDTPEEKP